MKSTFKSTLRFTLCLIFLSLVVVPLSAQIIEQGTDLWRTPGDGSTFASFAINPLPADFFCQGSSPFAGKVIFRGAPVSTEPAGILEGTDTVIHRIDDAGFNAHGVATTRIQMKAMAFEGVEPLRNECGTFRVGVELDGEQPVTEMKIVREEENGGYYIAPLHVNVNITFTPMDHGGETLRVPRQIRFGPAAQSVWSTRPGEGFPEVDGEFQVDTDNDGAVDTFLPGTSRAFFAGSRTGLDRSREDVLRRREAPVAREGVNVAGSLKGGMTDMGNAASAREDLSNAVGAAQFTCHWNDGCQHCTCGELCVAP